MSGGSGDQEQEPENAAPAPPARPRPRPTPVGERSHRLHWFTGRVHQVLDDTAGVLTATMTETERGETLAEIARLHDRLEAITATLVADDETSIEELRRRTNVTARTARRIRKRARALEAHPEVAAALVGGEIHTDQAEVITHAVDTLPEEVSHLRKEAEAHLLELALAMDADALKTAAGHLVEVVAPDLADELLARQLEKEEREARRTAYLKTYKDGHGSTYGKFKVPDLHGHLLETLLAAIANPGRPEPIDRTSLDAHQIKGTAFCELVEKVKTEHLPRTGGTPVSVLVTIPLSTLEGGLKAAGILGTDLKLSPGEARRLAARHGVIPVVLDGPSQVLDIGRKQRFFTPAQRIAMAIRQGGKCNRQGCDVPAAWCEANHRTLDWAKGGRTDLDKGELVCGHDHTLHHQGINFPRRT